MENFLKVVKYTSHIRILVYSYGCLSNAYSWKNKPNLALFYATKGIEVREKINDTQKADALIFMGNVYRYQDDILKARFY